MDKRRKKNTILTFTLLELVIVLVILSILATIAIPMYWKTVERSRAIEAIKILGYIREAQMEYNHKWGTFCVADDIVNTYTNTSSGTSWENKLAVGFNSALWEFTITDSGPPEDWVTVSARRSGKSSYINLYIESDGSTFWSGNHPGTPSN